MNRQIESREGEEHVNPPMTYESMAKYEGGAWTRYGSGPPPPEPEPDPETSRAARTKPAKN